MKKILLFTLAIGVLTFVDCANDDEISKEYPNETEQTRMGFVTSMQGNAINTRGTAVTVSNVDISNFQTWGYDAITDALYMGNSATVGRNVVKNGSGEWEYSPTQYWPVNRLSFVAIAPAAYSGVTASTTASSEGVVSIASEVNLPTDVKQQVDLMYAEADKMEKPIIGGNIPLTFKHALSQVIFKGKFSDAGAVTKVTIAEITMGGINGTGTVNFTSEGNFHSISSIGTPTAFKLTSENLEGATFETSTEGTEAFNLTTSENVTKRNAWFLLPQKTAAATGGAYVGSTAPADGAYIKIRTRMEKDGVIILDNNEADALYLPLTVNWERSKKYIYTIEFNGTSALTPITFSVTAEDWKEVVTSDIPKSGDTIISDPSKIL